MIDKIILHNFQSHAHTEVEFSHGINSIIGDSNNGKTSLFRAFQWVWKNRPTGMDFVSHWATELDKNDNLFLTDDCSVTVIFSEGKYVTREKTKDGFNGYRMGSYSNGEFKESDEFAKVGTSVPYQVEELFHMDNVNIQNQFDSMFLLSDTGQDVARYFNRLIKLESSDAALSAIRTKKRLAKREEDLVQAEVNELSSTLKELEWVEQAIVQAEKIDRTDLKLTQIDEDIEEVETLIENLESIEPFCSLPEYHVRADAIISKIEVIDAAIEKLDDYSYEIESLVVGMQQLQDSIDSSKWIPDALLKVGDIENQNLKIQGIRMEIAEISELIEAIESSQKNMTLQDYIPKASESINKIDEINSNIFRISEDIDEIEMLIGKMENCQAKIASGIQVKADLEKQMPERCPFCNKPLGDNHEIAAHS